MLNIRIVAVGCLKEKYLVDAVAEYAKRLTRYCRLEIIQIRESDIKTETSEIQTKLKGHVILCDIGGELFSSAQLSQKIQSLSQTTSCITFVVGGSNGVGQLTVNQCLSFGRITLPHQLFRVILVEQIYRAFTIIKGEKYHK